MYLGSWDLNQYLTLKCVTRRPDTGALNQADISPQYLIYKDDTTTPIVTGTFTQFITSNKAFYANKIQLTAANGFSQGSTYTVYISGQVSGVAGAILHDFQIKASVNLSGVAVSGGTAPTVQQIRQEMDSNSTKLAYITGNVATSGQVNAAFNNNLNGTYVSGSINYKMANLATSSDLSTSVWDVMLAQHLNSGSAGYKLNSIPSVGASGAALTAADVWNYSPKTLSSFGFSVTVGTNNDKTGYSLTVTPPTATQIRQEIDSNSTALQFISGQAVTTNSRLTATRAGYLDNLSAGAVALQSTLSALDIPTSGEVANAVWDTIIAQHIIAGSTGNKLNSLTSGSSSLTAADVWNYATRTLSAFGFSVTVGTNNDKTGYALTITPPTAAQVRQEMDSNSELFYYLSGQTATTNNRLTSLRAGYLDNLSAGQVAQQSTLLGLNIPTSGQIADAVWDEQLSGHSNVGSSGQKLSTVSSSGAAGDMWATLIPGEYGAGTAGKIVGDNLNTTVSSRSSHSASDVRIEIDSNSTKLNYISGEASKLSNSIYGLAAIESLVDELENRLTADRASYLDELSSANIPADIDILISRLTSLRAGYLDYLSGGAVATHQDALNIRSDISAIPVASGGATLSNQNSIISSLSDIKGSGFNTSINSLKSMTDYVSGGITVDVNPTSIWEVDTSTITDTDAIGNKIERLVRPIVRF